jgi:N-acetylglucosaminyltransferase
MSPLFQDLLVISSILASIFWWFQLVFAYFAHRREQEPYLTGDAPPISVVVPAYNETQEAIDNTVNSILIQKQVEIELIVVDDGSKIPVTVQKHPNVRLVRLDTNQGKRHAQMAGIRLARYDWIATVDSDTILDPRAIWHLYKSAEKQRAAAITGSVFLSNENENWLTKLTSCVYWFSFFQERAAQSHFGSMMCCSGALSLYRKDVILKYDTIYLNQRFLGLQCHAGDDRHLTNLFLLSGNRVGWSARSVAYTPSPPTLYKFHRQQLRWVRSHVASLWFLFSNMHRWNLVFGFLTMKLLYRYIYMIFIYVVMITLSISYMSVIPWIIILVSILLVTLVKASIAMLYTGKFKFLHMLVFSIYTFFIFNPIMFYGVISPQKVGWYTRDKPYNIECDTHS